MKAKRIEVYGKVQSVGFRPFIYNLAKKLCLNGYVKNKTSCVEILVEGEEKKIREFLDKFKSSIPKAASIEKILIEEIPSQNLDNFNIVESEENQENFIYIPAEIKVCGDCLKELFNPLDRRYLYPFINCTQCGPRFTIVEKLPYDRKNTTMRIFKMCQECLKEYNDPSNRRFHAQPNGCYRCGPGLVVKDNECRTIIKLTKSSEDVKIALNFIIDKILEGKILAVKSYGGYHLVCDATNDEVVIRLRKLKKRDFKPFAMMVSSVEVVERYCVLEDIHYKLLNSPQAPIVLIKKKENKQNIQISSYVTEESKYYGFMLPYTPLQFLIFYFLKERKKDIPLVMTSANLSDEPQVFKEQQAFEKLKGIADYFVIYNRKINIRCDDSVCSGFKDNIYFIRRARGWAPEPIFVRYNFKKNILAFGADLKNTFSLARDNYVIVSHHIGDLDNLEAVNSYEESIEYYLKTFRFFPEVVICDKHPLYISSKIAKTFAEKNNIKCITKQHHYSHMLSCMLENNLFEKCIGIIFDGTGYGLDDTIWGSEFLVGDIKDFKRKAYFSSITLVGGDKGIKEPYRTTIGFLYEEYKDKDLIKKFWDILPQKITKNLKFDDVFMGVKFLIDNKINTIATSGMGRFFDIVAVLCGFGFFNYYEGYLPQYLEKVASLEFKDTKKKSSYYDFEIIKTSDSYLVDIRSILKKIFEDILNGRDKIEIALKFHHTISKISLELALKIRNEMSINKVVLSGGVFQNQLLLSSLYDLLKENDFEVFIHRKLPCNDAGISFGQVLTEGEISLW
ncbi:MAG: carbamoyltransferase HypF [Elusimicrobiota bacterium]|nr:carbamoyltransferase HypF [Endomicrobiia bacterium]MDW8165569.1 carbamoyltransferase HypF [Elusimicrobiota bacterium]